MANKVTTLIDVSTQDELYPRTKASAVSDNNGNALGNLAVCNYTDTGSGSVQMTDANGSNLYPVVVKDEYVAGDTVDLSHLVVCAGLVTTSKTDLVFTIPLSKPIKATSVTFSHLTVTARVPAGGYALQSIDLATASNITLYTWINETGISVKARRSSAYSNTTNNTPIAVQLEAKTDPEFGTPDGDGTVFTFA